MKRKLSVFASAAVLTATLIVPVNQARAANSAGAQHSKIPPVPASSQLQVPPQPTGPAKATQAAQQPAVDKSIYTVAESRRYVSKTATGQHFVDYINLKAGQDKMPLKLKFFYKGFNYLSCSIGGYPLFDRKRLQEQDPLVITMTGNIGSGSSQVLLDAYGPPGSTLNWVLIAPKPTLREAKPSEVGPGDTIKLSGTHFCPEARWNEVQFGDKKIAAESATKSQLEIKVPDDVEAGKQKISVTVLGQKTGAVEVEVNAPPELSGVSLHSAPPGQEITLTGKHFAKSLGKNKVSIGGSQAQIVAGGTSSLTVIIPSALDASMNPAYGVPITVEVGKQKSKENVTIDIQSRVF